MNESSAQSDDTETQGGSRDDPESELLDSETAWNIGEEVDDVVNACSNVEIVSL